VRVAKESAEAKQKLTAVFVTDVVGYSRLMGDDHHATVKTLAAYRAVFSSHIEKSQGRIVNAPGDSILAEFESVVDAVNCAVEIQRELAEHNQELPENRRMHFRIGVNLGDVLIREGELFGDGVNIAARLESLADPGGVCISRTVYDQVHTRLDLDYDYLGEHKVKNIATPVRVYKVLLEPGQAPTRLGKVKRTLTRSRRKAALAAAVVIALAVTAVAGWNLYQQRASEAELAAYQKEAAFPLPEKPSIAVLAFDNLSGDPEQEFFSDGLAEDIITDLSRISGIFVVARNSSFTFKGKSVDVAEVGQKLGVRYVLEGSVRKAGDSIRLSVQLIDAASRKHLWAERYERELKDVFAVQDEITEKIVSNLKVQMTMGEGERMRRNTTDSPEAWEYYLKGRELYRKYNEGAYWGAQDMFDKALELDPKFEAAMVGLGKVYAVYAGRMAFAYGVPDPYERAAELANQALKLDKTLPEPHELWALIHVRKKNYGPAVAAAERAAATEPNVADFQFTLGWVRSLVGRHEEALAAMKKGMRLDPLPPYQDILRLGIALYFSGRPEEAIPLLEESQFWGFEGNYFLIASYVAAGQMEDAKWAAGTYSMLWKPSYLLTEMIPFKNPADVQRMLEDLAKAGVK
jgi:TolB-like protein/class 3 adenylate cyclase